MMYDSHLHSKVSADSQMDPADIIETANKLGIGIVFTEHIDYDLPGWGNQFVCDYDTYLGEYRKYRSDTVLTGLEIGLTAGAHERNKAISKDERIDFVLGSVHQVDDEDIYVGFLTQDKPQDDIYMRYLECVYQMVEANDFFDSLSHIDYPSRPHCKRAEHIRETNIKYERFSKQYDRILNLLIDKNKCLELNTVMLGNKDSEANLTSIFKAYRRLGGKYITVGSDAHRLDVLGHDFNNAYKLAARLDLSPVHYVERKMCI